jgi:hypothetical protein
MSARDHHRVADPRRDLLLAARAYVGLAGLERVDLAHIHLGGIGGVGVHPSILVEGRRRSVS